MTLVTGVAFVNKIPNFIVFILRCRLVVFVAGQATKVLIVSGIDMTVLAAFPLPGVRSAGNGENSIVRRKECRLPGKHGVAVLAFFAKAKIRMNGILCLPVICFVTGIAIRVQIVFARHIAKVAGIAIQAAVRSHNRKSCVFMYAINIQHCPALRRMALAAFILYLAGMHIRVAGGAFAFGAGKVRQFVTGSALLRTMLPLQFELGFAVIKFYLVPFFGGMAFVALPIKLFVRDFLGNNK